MPRGASNGPPRTSLPPLSPTRLQRLYVEQGLSIRQVAEKLGCTSDQVKRGLRAAGITPRAPGGRDGVRLPPITSEQLQELYVQRGLSAREVAQRLGGEETRVLDALRRHGIPVRLARPRPGRRGPRVPQLDLDAAQLTRLYVDQQLSDSEIGCRYGVSTWQVCRRRAELGVVRRTGTARPAPPTVELRHLYVDEQLWLTEIARRYRARTTTVREWLLAADIPLHARRRRRDRLQLDPKLLRQLYEDEQWTAGEIAAELGVNPKLVLRTLHDNAIPVRAGGIRSRRTAEPTHLLHALYADSRVRDLMRRHHLPHRPQPGPIADRFPSPAPLTDALLREAYLDIGLSARQIELISGHSTERIIPALNEAGIGARAGGRASPWLAQHLWGDRPGR